MKTARPRLLTRALTNLIAIVAVATIFGAKALEHEHMAAAQHPHIALRPASLR